MHQSTTVAVRKIYQPPRTEKTVAEETFELKTASRMIRLYPGNGRLPLECEMILPEYKEGVHRILRPEARPVIRSKSLYLQAGTAVMEVQGVLDFTLLYFGEEERDRVRSFSSQESFSFTFRTPVPDGVVDEGSLCGSVEAFTENLTFKLMGPRRILLRTDLTLQADMKANESFSFVDEPCARDVFIRGEKAVCTCLLSAAKGEFVLEERVVLPQGCLPVEEIVSLTPRLFADQVKCENGGISFRVLCDLDISYLAAEEKSVISVCQPVEIVRRMGVSECNEENSVDLRLSVEEVKWHLDVDESGEMRVICVEMTYRAHALLYGREELFVLEDAFSTESEMLLTFADESWETHLGSAEFCLDRREEIEFPTEGILRTEAVTAEYRVREAALSEGKILLDGKLCFSCLGITADGETVKMEGTRECRVTLPSLSGLTLPERECRIELSTVTRSPDLVAEAGKVKLRFELCGSVSLFSKEKRKTVASLSRGECFPRREEGLIYLYPEEGESLWSICKKYRVSPSLVQKENGLVDEALPRVLHFCL